MRILYFSRDYTAHDHRFLSALARTEHKVYYLRLERGANQLEDRPLPAEIEQVQWKGGRKPVALRDGPGLLFELKRVIRQVKPDLIHAGPLQRSAFLVALAGFHPLVSMSWGYDLIQDAQIDPGWRWATRYTLKRSAVMVGDCSTTRQIARTFGMPDERIVTFPWGVDLAHFSSAGAQAGSPRAANSQAAGVEREPPPFTLLSTRSWEPVYGVDVIARAFVQAARQRPELRLVMLGGGSQNGLVRKILASGGLLGDNLSNLEEASPSRVVFPGQVSYADLPRFYRAADLYVAATHSDGTSISLLEAMACGVPALVSDIPGNREWVIEGENGWLFPDGDAEALARAILKAVDERSCLPEMGAQARKLAEQRADWDRNFQELLRAYTMARDA